MEANKQFGRNLRRRRRMLDLTQEDLSRLTATRTGERHMSVSEISRLERGTREPRLGTIVRLAHALGIEPVELLDGVATAAPQSRPSASR